MMRIFLQLEEGSVIFVYDASPLDGTSTEIVTDDLSSLVAAFQQKVRFYNIRI